MRSPQGGGNELEVLVGQEFAGLLADCDFISAVHLKGTGNLMNRTRLELQLLAGGYDAIIGTWHYPRYRIHSLLRLIKHRRDQGSMDPELQHVSAMRYRLSALGGGLIPGWDGQIDTTIPIKPERLERALQIAEEPLGCRYLTIAPGASTPEKQWPVRKFAELTGRCSSEFEAIFVVGSPEEQSKCEEVALATPNASSLAGKLSLIETSALVSGAELHIGNCSGLGHIAAGNGVKVIVIGCVNRHYAPCGHSVPHFSRGKPVEPDQVVAVIRTP